MEWIFVDAAYFIKNLLGLLVFMLVGLVIR